MSKRRYRIAHLTTVHPRYDTRIFYKECIGLSEYYDVLLVVNDGKGDEVRSGIRIYDLGGESASRLKRMIRDSRKMFRKAKNLKCDLYHFHDPELMFVGLKLMRLGKKVIFDVHEEVPDQIMSKPYLSEPLKKIISYLYRKTEKYVIGKLSGVVTATSHIRERLEKKNPVIEDIKNYPVTVAPQVTEKRKKENAVCYVGTIAEHRGILEMLEVIDKDVRLLLAGRFEDESIKKKCFRHEHWKYVDYVGFVDNREVKDVLAKAKAGMVVLHKLKRYEYSLPVKLFEYMEAGLPVIVSDIPFWCEIINDAKCGICVDPLDTGRIRETISRLLTDAKWAEQLGKNGQKAVEKKYNWENEKIKLADFYRKVLVGTPSRKKEQER